MRNILKNPLQFFRKKNKISFVFTTITAAVFCALLLSNKNGPASNGSACTGAPFNRSRTCTECHSGGNFGGQITTQLLDGTTPVTKYTPGKSYIFQIVMTKTTGTPQYGFQTTAATAADANVNTWGTLPFAIHNTSLSGRNYIEHSTRFTSGTFSIPWTGPATGTGNVSFYTAGNLVNANNSTSGDQTVSTSLTVLEDGVLPVSLLYFKGELQNGKAVLTWATAQETSNKNFTLEKSLTGSEYSSIAVLASKNTGGNQYSYTDNNFSNTAFYRLKQTDLNGSTTIYNVVNLKAAASVKYSVSVYTHAGGTGVLFYNGAQTQKVNVRFSDMNGKLLYTYNTTASPGNNLLMIPGDKAAQVMIVTILTEDGVRTSAKVGIIR